MSGGIDYGITGGDARALKNLPEGITPADTMGLHPRRLPPGLRPPLPQPPRDPGSGKPPQRESVTLTRPKGGDGKR